VRARHALGPAGGARGVEHQADRAVIGRRRSGDGHRFEKRLEANTVTLPVGREYLAKLREKASKERERQTKARALSVQVHKLFNPLEEEISCKKVASDGMLIDIAHLIDSKSVEKYQNRYSMAAKQLKNCELQVSGPWPPYHFLPGKLRTVAGNS